MIERLLVLGAGLAVMAGSASARTAEERNQFCVASVAELRDIDAEEVLIEETDRAKDGGREVFFRTPVNRGSCMFDSTDRLIDVRMGSGAEPWNGRGGGDVSAQEQACAGELSRRTNVPMSQVTVSRSRPAPKGGRRMIVTVEGARADCVTTQYNAISEFRLVDYTR